MKRIIYHSNFKDLRKAYIEIQGFLKAEVGDSVDTLATRVYNDLGCSGDDSYELIEKFVFKYRLDTTGFIYSEHFLSERELFSSGPALLNMLLSPILILIRLLKLITFNKIDLNPILPALHRETLDLTFGDMLTWYITGRYNLRKHVSIQITTNA